jgi:cation diffusion facilitator CzcD-associated flavoprotein CzcO
VAPPGGPDIPAASTSRLTSVSSPLATVKDASAPSGALAPHHRVVIVGAGFGGIALAIALQRAGLEDVVVLEKEQDLGGTWLVNTYPGCQCDVPSLLYSLSGAPNAEWTRTFAPQPEIEDYLREVADRFDLKRRIHFGTELLGADWEPAGQRWLLETSAGPATADVVILAAGFLSEPRLPDIEGLDRFEGTVFHSARWDHDHDLTGERVAVIGTGASAIQFVPEIQPEVAHLTVFQRTAPWVMPRPDRPFARWEHWLFGHSRLAARLSRARIYWSRELLVLVFARYPALSRFAAKGALRHLEDQVEDPGLRAKLTPAYALGCKRVLLSNEYFPALTRANTEVVTEPITEVLPHAVLTADGLEHPVDTIILGTGFEATEQPIARRVRAGDGRTMRQHWGGSMRSYLGTTVPDFPNLFMIVGPNTGLGHSSMIFMIESQANYVVDALKTMSARNLTSVTVDPEAVDRFDQEMQHKLTRTVWNTGCSSWYLDASGRNTTLWPDFTWQYRLRTRRFDPDRYRLTRASEPPIPNR